MNGIDTRADDYLRRVRAALADLPAEEVAEIMEDLEAHVAEVFAEAGSAHEVERRLGTPEEYAAELRAAGGYPSAAAPDGPRARVWLGRLVVWAAAAVTAAAWLGGALAANRFDEDYLGLLVVGGLIALPAVWLVFTGVVRRADVEQVPEYRWGRARIARLTAAVPWTDRLRGMRGAWRLLRLVVLALAALAALGADDGYWLLAILAAAVVLAWLGPRSDTDRRLLLLVVPANALTVGLALALAVLAVNGPRDGYYYPVATADGLSYNGMSLENVVAVDKDGELIPEFYLFDDLGNPLNVSRYGCAHGDYSRTNKFPAPVVEYGPNGCVALPAPSFVPLPPGMLNPTATAPPTTTTAPPTTTTK